MVLTYEGALPEGALARADTPPPAPIWLHAATRDLAEETAGGRLRRWPARAGSWTAEPAEPNHDGTRFQPGEGLVFESGINSGLILRGAIGAAETVSFALIFRTGEADAETLATLLPVGQSRYLYLAGRDGMLRAGMAGGALALEAPLGPPGGWRLALCGLSGGRARLALDTQAAVSGGLGRDFAGPAALFIGCRGNRGGLKGKLGAFTLRDLFVWPGVDLLAGAEDAALARLHAYWQGLEGPEPDRGAEAHGL